MVEFDHEDFVRANRGEPRKGGEEVVPVSPKTRCAEIDVGGNEEMLASLSSGMYAETADDTRKNGGAGEAGESGELQDAEGMSGILEWLQGMSVGERVVQHLQVVKSPA